MRLKILLPLLASVSLVSSPVFAAAQPARVATPVKQSEELRGGSVGGGTVIVVLLGLSAIILGIIAAAKGHDRPNSP